MGIWTIFFKISEQKYAKTEMEGGFDTYENFLKMTLLLMTSTPESCNPILKTQP